MKLHLKPTFFIFPILFVLCFFISLSNLLSQDLPPYYSQRDHVNYVPWIAKSGKDKDIDGIILSNKNYHPLSIAGFGIANYYHYKATGDSVFYKNVLNQYKYFCDTTKVIITDNGTGMGLPYRFKFHDLNPPWYSGMAQGVGISFLLRYFKLTNDSSALYKAMQLKNVLLKPQEKGGTISKTREKLTFIEEYPNSKSNPQVLNGFINGLIGLYEYLLFFPDDTLAQRIHNESYFTMIKTFGEYDLPEWTKYNRGNKRISNHYLRYQITELEHLNFIYNDYRLIKQMMLWSFYAWNKSITDTALYKHPHYQYAVPFNEIDNIAGSLEIDFSNGQYIDTSYTITLRGDNIVQLKRNKIYQINLSHPVYTVNIQFDVKIEPNDWNFTTSNKQPTKTNQQALINGNQLKIKFDSLTTSFNFAFNTRKERKINIKKIEYFDRYQFETPRFGFYRFTKPEYLKADSVYNINLIGERLSETEIFYRHNKAMNALNKEKYMSDVSINGTEKTFKPLKNGYYQFVLISPAIEGLWFEKTEKLMIPLQ